MKVGAMNQERNFATTQWTLVWRAANEESGYGRPALTEIVKRYWHPLYSYARQKGLNGPDAEDATQEFLTRVFEGDLLSKADPAKGRFRSYLLAAWKRFLIDQYRKENRLKRGGQESMLSLDYAAGERQYLEVAAKEVDADRSFMIGWASSLLADVRQRMQNDYTARGKNLLFELLWSYLTTPIDAAEYDRLGKQMHLSASAVKVALHRLRQRFGETLRQVVGETVEDACEIDNEIQELLGVLGGR